MESRSVLVRIIVNSAKVHIIKHYIKFPINSYEQNFTILNIINNILKTTLQEFNDLIFNELIFYLFYIINDIYIYIYICNTISY